MKIIKSLNHPIFSFKPCYKWITFNTHFCEVNWWKYQALVLNLVINGLPSIHCDWNFKDENVIGYSFKPCYKWITFNTLEAINKDLMQFQF